jgi:hypothetical protein
VPAVESERAIPFHRRIILCADRDSFEFVGGNDSREGADRADGVFGDTIGERVGLMFLTYYGAQPLTHVSCSKRDPTIRVFLTLPALQERDIYVRQGLLKAILAVRRGRTLR